jgi:hypothetical protein
MLKKTLAVTALALLTSPSALAAAGGCHAIVGTHTNQNVPCVVPALACVESQTTGTFAGTALTVITGFDPTTGIFTGTTTNFLTNGAIIENTIVGTGAGSVITITGGTRQFAHATGGSVTTAPTTTAPGTSTGEYCLGNGKGV